MARFWVSMQWSAAAQAALKESGPKGQTVAWAVSCRESDGTFHQVGPFYFTREGAMVAAREARKLWKAKQIGKPNAASSFPGISKPGKKGFHA